MPHAVWAVLIVLTASFLGISTTLASAVTFDEWIAEVRAEAASRGVSEAVLDKAFSNVKPIPKVVELDRKQPEFRLKVDEYLSRVINQRRINTGRRLLAENADLLNEVAEQYGVQPRFIVALWGIETDYGRVTGGFPVIGALATLAYDGRRAAFFREQLLQALDILEQGHIAPAAMKGSWAGAMGQSQFMPSSFHSFAVEHDGDGDKDIWQSREDVFGSIANYLARRHDVGP